MRCRHTCVAAACVKLHALYIKGHLHCYSRKVISRLESSASRGAGAQSVTPPHSILLMRSSLQFPGVMVACQLCLSCHTGRSPLGYACCTRYSFCITHNRNHTFEDAAPGTITLQALCMKKYVMWPRRAARLVWPVHLVLCDVEQRRVVVRPRHLARRPLHRPGNSARVQRHEAAHHLTALFALLAEAARLRNTKVENK